MRVGLHMTHKLCLRINITQVPQSLPERTILNSSSSVEVPAQENRRGFNSISSRSVTNVLTRTYSSLYVALPSASLLDFELTRTQRERCLKVARELLEDGKSVAVGMFLPAATSQSIKLSILIQTTPMQTSRLASTGLSSQSRSRFQSDACISQPLRHCANITMPFDQLVGKN